MEKTKHAHPRKKQRLLLNLKPGKKIVPVQSLQNASTATIPGEIVAEIEEDEVGEVDNEQLSAAVTEELEGLDNLSHNYERLVILKMFFEMCIRHPNLTKEDICNTAWSIFGFAGRTVREWAANFKKNGFVCSNTW
eukprot:Pompholyxophrys_punicea_v1_NODE_49_length_4365_cov_16.421810.p2 type:complete len:136 gc:universal NODE_49_length_4365_cov_16.421810:3503-3096(-)